MRLPLPKRTRIVTAIAAIGFVALLVAGPFASSERGEMLFALALIVGHLIHRIHRRRRRKGASPVSPPA